MVHTEAWSSKHIKYMLDGLPRSIFEGSRVDLRSCWGQRRRAGGVRQRQLRLRQIDLDLRNVLWFNHLELKSCMCEREREIWKEQER